MQKERFIRYCHQFKSFGFWEDMTKEEADKRNQVEEGTKTGWKWVPYSYYLDFLMADYYELTLVAKLRQDQ